MQKFYKFLLSTLLSILLVDVSATQRITLIGEVRDYDTKEALIGASVIINGDYLWAVSSKDGEFRISNIDTTTDGGELEVSYLGYFTKKMPITAELGKGKLIIYLRAKSLTIEEVTVTAQSNRKDINTSYTIDRDALKHTQITDIAEIAALLPGGKTSNPDLTSENVFSLRNGDSDTGNAAFGTAVEVDGVRLSNNASFGALDGMGTRNIAVENIESIEIITGVPSVEYGDINSGVVKVKTRRGKSPLNATVTVNPKTYQVSASKGFAVSENGGIVNLSGELARATSNLVSPYDSYTRRGLSAIYSNTFKDNLKFESGVTMNIGGSNSEDDPDAYSGEYTTGRDNVLRANTSLEWLVNKSWITNLKFDLSASYNDRTTHSHTYYSYASQQPAVHATEEGYFIANQLGYNYFADSYVESKELNLAGAIKYELNHKLGSLNSRFKAGVQWKMTGNKGKGEYYADMATAPSGFRERDYSTYPYMHNLSFYAEERLSIPIANTLLTVIPGVRVEELFVKGAAYKSTTSVSPRFNASLKVNSNLTIRGGWGVTEKLPSYYILYPNQEYRDILSFGATYNNNEAFYSYYTQPYALETNPELRWQRNYNSEIGMDFSVAGIKFELTAYSNRTKGAYQYSNYYTPFSYNTYVLPSGYSMPSSPEIKVDSQTGDIYVRDSNNPENGWTSMDVNVTNTTFTKTTYADNGADVYRKGLEAVINFPEIKSINTKLRLDAAYTYVDYLDNSLSYSYSSGLSHTTESGKSYQYVGIYAMGNNSSSATYNGSTTRKLDANITAVTHIPSARLIISCRVEMSLLNRWKYKSEYNGEQYAFNSDEYGNAIGGSIYDGGSYTAIYPIKYMDTSGQIHDFTSVQANDPNFANLIRVSNNAYTFSDGGYDPYVSANLSVTKEIGERVSLSFFANNFTFSRKAVTSYSTGVSAIFVPNFYYGLTCRIKL
ncbi:MAG: TonB-dependent receptor [Rikenellaceae bacterium]